MYTFLFKFIQLCCDFIVTQIFPNCKNNFVCSGALTHHGKPCHLILLWCPKNVQTIKAPLFVGYIATITQNLKVCDMSHTIYRKFG